MQRFLLYSLLFISLPLISLSYAQSPLSESRIEEQFELSIKLGDQFYLSREVPGNAKVAMEYYETALRLKPNVSEVYWRLSRAMYGRYRMELNRETKRKMIQEGITYAKKAVELDPQNVNAHLFLGLHYGNYVTEVGLLRGWKYVFPVKEEMETILAIEPTNSYALILLGLWYHTVPSLFGGDKEKGLQYSYQAIQYQPDYTSHYYFLGQQLLKMGRKEEASQVLRRMFLIKKPFDPMIAIEDRYAAKKMMAQYQLSPDIANPTVQ